MPPILALLLTVAFMGWLFRRDLREKPNVTNAIWLPTVWMFLVSSRSVSKWLSIFGLPLFAATTAEEGSSLDAIVFLAMIALGIYILNQRRINLSDVIQNN